MRKHLNPLALMIWLMLMLTGITGISICSAELRAYPAVAQSIQDVRGSHSTDQPLTVLATRDLSGTTDNWSKYVEFYPAGAGYYGVVTFRLPSAVSAANVQRIVVTTNYRGPARKAQRWIWALWDNTTRSYVQLGDNATAASWKWTVISWTKNGNSFINPQGEIKIRLASNNSVDVCDIDQLSVEVYADQQAAVNQAPVVNAGADRSIQLPTSTVQLAGNVTDDGLPSGSTLQPTWSMMSGPAAVTFSNAASLQPQATFSAAGDYVLALTVTDGLLAGTDTVVVTVAPAPTDGFRDIPLQSSITRVQPMTGIVFWTDSEYNQTDSIQLEYSYMRYDSIVQNRDQFNWAAVDNLLAQVAARGHQAILRFYYVYPGQETTVPQYIKNSAGYQETLGVSEGQSTWFPDWSSPELQSFTKKFFTRFAERYGNDPRLAFLQVGFGLWAEYHIYDGPMILGETFPSKAYQAEFIQHMNTTVTTLPWSISIDAADSSVSPFAADPSLLTARFGLFDDSFLNRTHSGYNAACFNFFNYQQRYQYAPMGGELNYYTDYDQRHALDVTGPHGISFEQMAAQYHISYMIGNDQPYYQPMSRIKSAGMATGYKFQVTAFKASSVQSKVTVKNTGISPIYYDAFVTVNGVRSPVSLKGLLPGQSVEYLVASGGAAPVLTIESDRLAPGQQIEFAADL